jgi:hypothetical protein
VNVGTQQAHALARARWPKRHDFIVEACPVLTAREALAHIAPEDRVLGLWRHPAQPVLVFLTRREGAAVRTWLVCPSCGSPRGALYQPPHAPRAPWRCRECVGGTGAMYASERYGLRHPLRAVLTPRKARSRERRAARERRLEARLLSVVRAQLAEELAADGPVETVRDRLATAVAGTLAAEPGEDAGRLLHGARDVVARITSILARRG